MLRMFVAAAIAYLLIPQDLIPHVSRQPDQPSLEQDHSNPVTPTDTLNAAGSLLQDIGEFCTRNPKACETGKAILHTAKETAEAGLRRLSSETKPDQSIEPNSDITSENPDKSTKE